jgi:hypothetical protein
VHNPTIIAPWPEWLICKIIEQKAEAPQKFTDTTNSTTLSDIAILRGIEGILNVVANAPEGQRNAVIFWAAKCLEKKRPESASTTSGVGPPGAAPGTQRGRVRSAASALLVGNWKTRDTHVVPGNAAGAACGCCSNVFSSLPR